MDTATKTIVCGHCGSTQTWIEIEGSGSEMTEEVVCLCGWRVDQKIALARKS